MCQTLMSRELVIVRGTIRRFERQMRRKTIDPDHYFMNQRCRDRMRKIETGYSLTNYHSLSKHGK